MSAISKLWSNDDESPPSVAQSTPTVPSTPTLTPSPPNRSSSEITDAANRQVGRFFGVNKSTDVVLTDDNKKKSTRIARFLGNVG